MHLPAEYLGPGPPSREPDPHVCLEVCLAAAVSLRLRPRGISFVVFFSSPPLTQMFEAICCAALSCVYNKEVLVWTGRSSARWRSDRCPRRAGGHRAVEVSVERCQVCHWPARESMQGNVFAFYIFFLSCARHHFKNMNSRSTVVDSPRCIKRIYLSCQPPGSNHWCHL